MKSELGGEKFKKGALEKVTLFLIFESSAQNLLKAAL